MLVLEAIIAGVVEAIIAGVVEAIIAGAFLDLKLKLCTSPFQVQL